MSGPEEMKKISSNSDAFPVVFKPIWEPFDEEAEKVVDRLIKDAQWPTTGPKAIKYRMWWLPS